MVMSGIFIPNVNMEGANPSDGLLRDTTWGRLVRDRSLRAGAGIYNPNVNMADANPSDGVNGTMVGV
jgi:hypothetical protein